MDIIAKAIESHENIFRYSSRTVATIGLKKIPPAGRFICGTTK